MRGRRSDRGLEQILDVLAAELLAADEAEIADALGVPSASHIDTADVAALVAQVIEAADPAGRFPTQHDRDPTTNARKRN